MPKGKFVHSIEIQELNPRSLVWLLLVGVASCGGGFYKVDDSVHKTASSGTAPQDVGYITATIDLQNKSLLTSDLYNKEHDSSLSHLYIYATFSADVAGPKQIPLYLIDFKKGSIDDTRGDELIAHYPFDPDIRGKPLFDIQTRAIKENVADTALKVWGITKGFSEKVATLAIGPQTAPVFDALDSAASVLQSLAATHGHDLNEAAAA